jgi:hypothetical protein
VRLAPLRFISMRFSQLDSGTSSGFSFRHLFHASTPLFSISTCYGSATVVSLDQILNGQLPASDWGLQAVESVGGLLSERRRAFCSADG